MRNPIHKKMTFEEALGKLEDVVEQLENGDVSLQNLLEQYTQGVLLSKFCLGALDQTQQAMDKLVREDAKGNIQESALQIEGE